MEPDEVEFMAETRNIQITSNFSCEALHFITGTIGPFKPGITVTVPLWLAISLRQQQRCHIIPPEWMCVEVLEECLNMEKQARNFSPMPSEHYMVETKLLLACAAEDIPRADEIRTLVKDLWDLRMSKLRTSVDSLIKVGGTHAALDNLTLMEINAIRPLLPHALDQLNRIKKCLRVSATQSQDVSFSFNISSSSQQPSTS